MPIKSESDVSLDQSTPKRGDVSATSKPPINLKLTAESKKFNSTHRTPQQISLRYKAVERQPEVSEDG